MGLFDQKPAFGIGYVVLKARRRQGHQCQTLKFLLIHTFTLPPFISTLLPSLYHQTGLQTPLQEKGS